MTAGWLLALDELSSGTACRGTRGRRLHPGGDRRRSASSAAASSRRARTSTSSSIFARGRRDRRRRARRRPHVLQRRRRAAGRRARATSRRRASPSRSTCACGPGSKGSGFASNVAALEHYYEEWGDLWERQTLTRTRLILGDRALARRVRRALRRARLRPAARRRTREGDPRRARAHGGRARAGDARAMAREARAAAGSSTWSSSRRRLQLVHGGAHPEVRAPSTRGALAGLARAGALPRRARDELQRALPLPAPRLGAPRGCSARARPTSSTSPSPIPARVATALGYPTREAFLDDYRRRTDAVRAIYDEVMA